MEHHVNAFDPTTIGHDIVKFSIEVQCLTSDGNLHKAWTKLVLDGELIDVIYLSATSLYRQV